MSRSSNIFSGRSSTSLGGAMVGQVPVHINPFPSFDAPPTPPRTNSTDSTASTSTTTSERETSRRSLHSVRTYQRRSGSSSTRASPGRSGQQHSVPSQSSVAASASAHRAAMIHAMMQQAARHAAVTSSQQQQQRTLQPQPRTPHRRLFQPLPSATTPPAHSPFRPVTGSGTVNPSVHPQFRSKAVCKLFCRHCTSIMCRRGMKAILLGNTKVELYSTDTPPTGVQLVYSDYLTQNCSCRIRDAACLGCGNVVGYHVTQPCEKCLEACNNGHFWMFLSEGVQPVERFDASGSKLLRWASLPCAEEDKDESDPTDHYDTVCR
ncbi:uncharacterized protein SPPG_08383 [Spizellomyces punctatus DAOM BR117]|uniref:Protein FAM72 n=1 Tax=Spizellomyces punctatus (strain DAOM BR117) TaxID=645134 RepID=A0A0L0H418_SPIPD|nr:uncharacterized protein SPPG_08383 [Spizellomyces punctatus DAOM BR117]KNC96230.1 hypothetical protein SPPG_08383 [Spizellomyces punctatus DAOM BR117]|eukprot:XP_016604270.1 hypothetical protein SPPG_08383 [Spizellomyces punctatus DAOM BR117]